LSGNCEVCSWNNASLRMKICEQFWLFRQHQQDVITLAIWAPCKVVAIFSSSHAMSCLL
jgi:hypothetical protein